MVVKVKKEYISRRDLRICGFTQEDAIFNALHEQINIRAAEKIELELYSEILINHGDEMRAEYARLIEKYGFLDRVTQEWLSRQVPALSQIEAEWREILISELLSSDRADA